MILIYYKTWIYQCLIIQVKSPSIDMVSRPELGSDLPFRSGRDSGRDTFMYSFHILIHVLISYTHSCTSYHLLSFSGYM